VTTLNLVLVSARQNELLAQAAAERFARTVSRGTPRPNRLVSVAKSVRSLLAGATDRPLTVPELTEYPFRS